MRSVPKHDVPFSTGMRASALVLILGLALAGGVPSLAATEDGRRTPGRAERGASARLPRSGEITPRLGRASPPEADGFAPVPPATPLGMRYVVETGPVAFGDVVPDQDSIVTGAIVVRVFSDRDWRLMLHPGEPLRSLDRGRVVPLSRLAWRSQGGSAHTPFRDGAKVTVAAGPRTSGAGALVAVDLRLRIGDEDPLGTYGTSFRLELAPE